MSTPGPAARQTVSPARPLSDVRPLTDHLRPFGARGDDRETLLRLAEATASTRELRAILQAVTDAGTDLAGAEFGSFFYNALDDAGEAYHLVVLSGAEAEHFRTMPAPRITPLFEPTFNGHGAVRVDDVTVDPRFSGMPPGHLPVRSYLAVPVVSRDGDEVYGSLLFGHREVGRFDSGVERAMRSVASQAAVALENARLFEAEQTARQQAEQTAERLSVQQPLTAALSAAATEDDVLEVLVRDVVAPLGADSVRVYVGSADQWRLVGFRGVPGSPPMPPPADALPPPILRAMRTGRPVARPTSVSDTDFPQLHRAGTCTVRASLCLPLVDVHGVRGAIGLIWTTEREFAAEEIDLLGATTRQLASTLERVRLFEAERRARRQLSESVAAVTSVAQTLQRSLLPRTLPAVPEVSVAVRYLPGERDVEVGGDWYDVVETETGPIFVIGDVQGHSLQAAAVMGQLRTGLHAYLAEGHELDVAVARANKLLPQLDPTVMATCCLAHLEVATGRLRVVRAGHPRPVVRRADGRVEQIDAEVGVPLGVLRRTTWPVTTVDLAVGDRLLLYTDGLVERRGDDIEAGVDRLCEAIAVAPTGDAGQAADIVLGRVGHDLTDDVALVVCDVIGLRRRQETASMRFSPGPDVVARARRFTGEVLEAWGCGAVLDDATLLVSEMVTNAVRHTDGRATLTLLLDVDRVRLTVTDSESRPPLPNLRFEPTATSGRGMHLIDVLSAAWGVEPTGSGKSVWAELITA